MRFWKKKATPGDPLVGVAVAAYVNEDPRQLPALECLVASYRAQTYQNWRCLITHDGAYQIGRGIPETMERLSKDPRVIVVQTKKKLGHFGHPHRQAAVERLLKDGCQWIGHSNGDNYYGPVFFEAMLGVGLAQKAPFVYCDCVHSHTNWTYFNTEPRYKRLDLGGFLVTADLAKRVVFDKATFNADGDYIDRLVAAAKKRVSKVNACLFVHN